HIPGELHVVVRHKVESVFINQCENVASGLLYALRCQIAVERHPGSNEIADSAVNSGLVTFFDCGFHNE
ncbi:MAG TPA: hypothetical protein PK745_15525, partial [bacterium]|nr:hypothetical protein [bacterium]